MNFELKFQLAGLFWNLKEAGEGGWYFFALKLLHNNLEFNFFII